LGGVIIKKIGTKYNELPKAVRDAFDRDNGWLIENQDPKEIVTAMVALIKKFGEAKLFLNEIKKKTTIPPLRFDEAFRSLKEKGVVIENNGGICFSEYGLWLLKVAADKNRQLHKKA